MQYTAIIGSTGMIGQPVTKAFMDEGYKVNLFVRDFGRDEVTQQILAVNSQIKPHNHEI